MKLSNIRQDSVNTIVATRADGKTISLYNANESEVTLLQQQEVKQGRTEESAIAAGLEIYARD